MTRSFSCQHGHAWQGDDTAHAQPCPKCGAMGQTLPLTPAPIDPGANSSGEHRTLSLTPDRPSEQRPASDRPVQSGRTRVPGYEILAELGRGGMGVVYKAEQTSLKRLVALKMILAGAHAGSGELNRFRIEAEAAARLRHPHIVQIYEVGVHEGLPYLSLEFVDGGSLERVLDGAPQAPRAAAAFAERLARAMHAAHQAGVVHRDLKPANILVSGAADGDAPGDSRSGSRSGARSNTQPATESPLERCVPKISDFGLAKQLDNDSGQTQTGQVMGTPCYMAPEQAAGQTRDVGPLSDVYALGAILYEMLTGRPPFRGAHPLDTLDQLRTQEPVSPSRLQPKIPGDLDRITLKCLEKEPRKRYASAQALADDLRSFLAGEPIQARPVSRVERAWKWSRRHPSAAALVAVSVLATLALLAGGLWHQRQLEHALTKAQQNEQQAIREKERAEKYYQAAFEAGDRLLNRVGEGPLARLPGMQQVQRELLQDSLAFYEGFLKELSAADQNDPFIRREAGRAYHRVGLIHGFSGQPKDAERRHLQAIALRQPLAAENPQDLDLQHQLATSYHDLGMVYSHLYETEKCREHFRMAQKIWGALPADHPRYDEFQRHLADSLDGASSSYHATSDMALCEASRRSALAIFQRLMTVDPSSPANRLALAYCRNNLATLCMDLRRPEEAEAEFLAAIALLEPLAKEQPDDVRRTVSLAACCQNLGVLAWSRQDRDPSARDAAQKRFQQTLDLLEPVAKAHPRHGACRQHQMDCHYHLGAFHRRQFAVSEQHYTQSIELGKELAREFPEDPRAGRGLAFAHLQRGVLYEEEGQPEKAAPDYEAACALIEPVVRQHPQMVTESQCLGKCWFHLAHLAWKRDEKAKAIELASQGIELLTPLVAKNELDLVSRATLCGLLAVRASALQDSGRSLEALGDLVRLKLFQNDPVNSGAAATPGADGTNPTGADHKTETPTDR